VAVVFEGEVKLYSDFQWYKNRPSWTPSSWNQRFQGELWLYRFRTRNNISFSKICGESASVDNETIND